MVVQDTTIMASPGPDAKEVGRRTLLAEFLRTRRARLTPVDVGLSPGGHRRVPGLRREEVAVLADVGITWYTWLEQGRPIRVAPVTLERIADVLRLDRHERNYLRGLVFFEPQSDGRDLVIPERLVEVVRGYTAGPAFIRGPRWDLLAWNTILSELFGFPESETNGANALRHAFLDPTVRERQVNWPALTRQLVASFRADYAHHIGEEPFEELITELKRSSRSFARLWRETEVLSPTDSRSVVLDHPVLGRVIYNSVTLLVPDIPQTVVVFGTIDTNKRRS